MIDGLIEIFGLTLKGYIRLGKEGLEIAIGSSVNLLNLLKIRSDFEVKISKTLEFSFTANFGILLDLTFGSVERDN